MGKESIRAWLYNESANYFIPEEEEEETSIVINKSCLLAVGGIETHGSSQMKITSRVRYRFNLLFEDYCLYALNETWDWQLT